MAAGDILEVFQSSAAFTMAGLNGLASGVAKTTLALTNSGNYPAALIYAGVTPTSAPTVDTLVEFYLYRGDGSGTRFTDGVAGTDSETVTTLLKNAPRLGGLTVNSTLIVARVFDTWRFGPLGYEWGVIVKNGMNVAFHASANYLRYGYYNPQVQ